MFPRFWIINNVSGVGTNRRKRKRKLSRYNKSLVLMYVAGVTMLPFLFLTEVVGYYNVAVSFLIFLSLQCLFQLTFIYLTRMGISKKIKGE